MCLRRAQALFGQNGRVWGILEVKIVILTPKWLTFNHFGGKIEEFPGKVRNHRFRRQAYGRLFLGIWPNLGDLREGPKFGQIVKNSLP